MKKVLLILAVLVFASVGWYVRSSRIHSRNVVLIVVDALRADRLSCYGYDRQTSPNIDKIAQQGTLFEQAFSPLPMTQPAFTTIFTSLHPHSHGIKWNDNSALSDKAITIAEILLKHGWQTSAVVGASNLDSVFGLSQGFQFFEDNVEINSANRKSIGHIARWERQAEEVNDVVLQWLDHRNTDRPFFLMIHYFDPHDPYTPPEQFQFGQSKSDLYDGEVAYVDAQVGELWKQLQSRKLMENTLLILTADHGEALGEHDVVGHKWKVYEEALHVPLILVGPEIPQGNRILSLAHHIDIAPTLLDYVGLSRPDFYEGKSLLPMLEKRQKIHEYVLMEKATPPFRAWKHEPSWKKYPYSQWAIRTEHEKFIWSSDGHYEFYDLLNDPNEKNNLFDSKRDRAIELFEAGYQERLKMPKFRLASHPGRKKGDRDAEQALRALGYLN